MRSVRAALVVATLGLVAVPSGASAQTVDMRVNPNVKWPDRELVVSLPSKQLLLNEQVSIIENGESARGATVTSEAANRKRGVVLAIDSSLTMRGDPIRQAMVAARSFARRRDENTPLGIVFFSREPRLALAPTADPRKIRTTLAVGPALTRGTRIFDAAGFGIKALRAAGLTSGAVVVLSDGAEAEAGSAITPSALATDARRANVRIFSVGLASRSFDDTSLRTMSATTGGRYGEAAEPRDLPPLFAAIGERLSSEFLIKYRSTAPAGSAVTIQARVAGFSEITELTYRAPQLAVIDTGAVRLNESTGLDGGRVMLFAVLAFFLILLIVYAVMVPKQRSLVSRVTDFAGPGGPAFTAPTMADVRPKKERQSSDRWKRFEELVELADVGLSAAAIALWTMLATVVVAWYFGFAAGVPPLVIFAIAVPFGVRGYLRRRVTKRRRDFEDQLPDNLQVLASALRAGYSFSGALASMVDDAPEPSRTELRRASSDEQLGVDIADALTAVGKRMDSQDFEYVGIVAKMQREAGGNTAEVLDQVIETIRARQQLTRMVRTLTAQGRLGGSVISAMPLVLAGVMGIFNPTYFDPALESGVGIGLFVVAGLMLTAGWISIRKIVDVEP